MGLLKRLKQRRDAKRADREAMAEAAREARRAGGDQPRSISETVADVAGQFPPEA